MYYRCYFDKFYIIYATNEYIIRELGSSDDKVIWLIHVLRVLIWLNGSLNKRRNYANRKYRLTGSEKSATRSLGAVFRGVSRGGCNGSRTKKKDALALSLSFLLAERLHNGRDFIRRQVEVMQTRERSKWRFKMRRWFSPSNDRELSCALYPFSLSLRLSPSEIHRANPHLSTHPYIRAECL